VYILADDSVEHNKKMFGANRRKKDGPSPARRSPPRWLTTMAENDQLYGGGITRDTLPDAYKCVADTVSQAVGANFMKRPGICRDERYRLPQYVPKCLDAGQLPRFLGKRAECAHMSGTGEEAGGGDYVPDFTFDRDSSALQIIQHASEMDGDDGIRKRVFKQRTGRIAALNPWRVHFGEDTALHLATGGGGVSRRRETDFTASKVAYIVGEEGMIEMLYMRNKHGRTPLHNMAASGFSRSFAYLCGGGFFDGVNLQALLLTDERGRTVIGAARAPAADDVGGWDVTPALEARKAETVATLEAYLDGAHAGWREAEAAAVKAAMAPQGKPKSCVVS
jgi:hypothetical protein